VVLIVYDDDGDIYENTRCVIVDLIDSGQWTIASHTHTHYSTHVSRNNQTVKYLLLEPRKRGKEKKRERNIRRKYIIWISIWKQ
jgi:hypothetical protein